jgi:hypothetical protein
MKDVEGRRLAGELYGMFGAPPTASGLARAFLIATRLHWGFEDNHGAYATFLRGLEYHGDLGQPSPTLKVDFAEEFDPANRQDYPGIFVGLSDGGVSFGKKVVGDYAGMSASMDASTYSRMASADLLLAHVHRSPQTALAMAESTADFFFAARGVFMRSFGLSDMGNKSISKPRAVPKAAETVFTVDLSVGLSFTTTMKVNLEGHRLKKWSLDLDNR